MSTTRKGLTSFLAGETIPNGRRVKLDSSTPTANTVLLAGATDEDIGVSLMEVSSIAAGKACPVQLNNEPGTVFITALTAITVNAIAYKAASGKVAATGTDPWGRAMESSAADGDIIEGLPKESLASIPVGAISETELGTALAGTTNGLGSLRVARAQFNPSLTAGERTVGAHTLGVTIPDDAIIVGGFIEVNTTFTSATSDTATIAISVESANDIVTAVAIATGTPWDAGRQAIIPKANTPESTGIKLTAARLITATVAVEAVTAGKATIFLFYVQGA